MSTIEKILLSLQSNGNDKKLTLTNSYQEKSVWLRNEFDVIRKLIKQNPRENLTNQNEELQSVTPDVCSSSSVAREQSGDGRKRKSPETVNAVKLSPQQKRTSVDAEDLVHQAGLPDLNKLKKEQLLAELEKRGNFEFSMKNVKPALIDALKDVLLSEHQNREAPEQPILEAACSSTTTDNVAVEQESTSMVLSTPSKPASMRGSLMADFRSIVQNGNTGASADGSVSAKPETAAEEQKKRVESEYKARMNRQRESVAARQSMLQPTVEAPAAPAAPVAAPSTVVEKVEPAPIAAPALVPALVPASAPLLSLEAPSSAASKDSIGSTASEGSIWMEVSSPVRNSAAEPETEAEIETTTEASTAPTATAEEEPVATASAVDSAHAARPRAESDASFQSCASTGSNVPKTTLSTASSSAKGTTTTSSHSSVRPIASKMASYNAEKPGVAKSVAPSLMKAKLASKPVEDPRAAAVLKKKDPLPENKPAPAKFATVSAAAPAQSVRPAVPVVAAPAPVAAPVVPAPAVVVAPVDSTATANAAPVKRGIFGFLSNSKKNITATPTAAAAGTAAASGAVPLSNSGLFSPSAQSSSVKSAPAMVDSIIKSAKMDTATAAPFSTSTTIPSAAPVAASKPAASESQADAAKGLSNSGKVAVASTPGTGSGAPLKNAFASKSLISNIVDNYNNAVKTPAAAPVAVAAVATPAAVAVAVASTPAAKPVAAPVAGVLRDITSTTNAPVSAIKPASAAHAAQTSAVPSTPAPSAQPAAAEVNEYVIEDRDDSDESGTDGEGEGGEEDKKPKQNVPDWARGPLLKEALERQYGLGGQVPMDPDLIFPEVTTCSLEEIFGAREGLSRKYAARSSSAHWEPDQMTLVEKRTYRKHMGYDRGLQAGAGASGAK